MNVNKYAGFILIGMGIQLFLGSLYGFGRIWPFSVMAVGLALLLAAKQPQARMGGFWALLAGIGGLALQLGYGNLYGPIFMIGAGAATLFKLNRREA